MGTPPPALSPGGASAPLGPSPACAGGFALHAVPRSRSTVFTLATKRSRSLVTSANRVSGARSSSLALDRRASRLRLAPSALIARASHAPDRCICCCCSTHSCTAPLCPRPAAGRARSARSTGVAVRGAFGGGGCSVSPWGGGGAAFPLPGRVSGGGGVVLPLDVNDVSPPPPRLPLPPNMDGHGKPCHVHPLRPPLLPLRHHIQPKDPSRGHRPLFPNPRHPRLHPPRPAHKPVGKQAHQLLPLKQVATPHDHNGAEMRRVPCTPRDSKTMSHTAERCRCRPSGPGGTFCVQDGSGCLGGRVTPSRGGSVWAVPKSSRDGIGPTTSRGACPAPVLASLPPPTERPERREPSLRPLPALLRVRPPPVPPGGSPCSSRKRGPGLNRCRAWCRMSGDHA